MCRCGAVGGGDRPRLSWTDTEAAVLAHAIPGKELRTAAPLSQQQSLSVRRRETNLADPSLRKCEQGKRCVTEKIEARGVGGSGTKGECAARPVTLREGERIFHNGDLGPIPEERGWRHGD